MTASWFQDMQDDTGQNYFQGWRCLTCGEVLDPVIMRNRTAKPADVAQRRRRRARSRSY
jgi:hypothetical protein